jgi:hypothetical protein
MDAVSLGRLSLFWGGTAPLGVARARTSAAVITIVGIAIVDLPFSKWQLIVESGY